MKKTLLVIAVLTIIFYSNSCKKDSTSSELAQYTNAVTCNEADDNLNTYSQKIKTILNNNCATGGCHDAGTQSKGRDYSTYSASKAAMDAKSYCCINGNSGCQLMPQGGPKLSAADIHDLTCWAKNNYPN